MLCCFRPPPALLLASAAAVTAVVCWSRPEGGRRLSLRRVCSTAADSRMASTAHHSASHKRKQQQSSSSAAFARPSTDTSHRRSSRHSPSDEAGSSGEGGGAISGGGAMMGQLLSRQPTLFEAGFSRRQASRRNEQQSDEQADEIEEADEQHDSKQSRSANSGHETATSKWTEKKRRTSVGRDREDDTSAPLIVHNPAAHRFEAAVGNDIAFLEYVEHRRGSRLVWDIWHTSVPAPLRQRGLAVHLCMAAFAAARSTRIGVLASCTYVSNKFLVDHPEQRDVVTSVDGAVNERASGRQQGAAAEKQQQQQQQPNSNTPRKMNGADRRVEQKDSPPTNSYGTRQSQLASSRASSATDATPRKIHTLTSPRSSPLSPSGHSSPPSLALDWYRHQSLLLPAGSSLSAHHCPLPHHPVLGRSHFPRILADIRRYQSIPPTAASVVLLFASLLSRPSEDETSYIRDGLHFLLQHVMSTAERRDFLEHSLPFALRHIHDLPLTFPSAGLPLLTASPVGSQSVHYSKHEVAAILSCSLFSMHAEHRGAGHLRFPSANFKELLIAMGRVARTHDRAVKRGDREWQRTGRAHNNDIEKLRCMLHYLAVVAKRPQHEMQHTILTFHRRSINDTADELLATALLSSSPLPTFTPFPPPHTIEDDLLPSHSLHLDFANKYIGGGVLGHGCVQEEILFSIAAECLASLLFCERMDVNEAIVIIGAERFCRYRGYGSSFEFAGAWEGKEQYEVVREERGRRRGRRVIVAIDAIPFSRKLLQWQDHAIARELLKAYVGFSVPLDAIASVSSPSSPTVSKLYSSLSTGNWGCGAFNGDVPLKAFIQLVAAGLSGRAIRYFTFGDRQCDGLDECVQSMHRLHMTVGEAMKHTLDYARLKLQKNGLLEHSLLDYLAKLQRSSDGSLQRMDKSGGGQTRGHQGVGVSDEGKSERDRKEEDGEEDDEGMEEVARGESIVPDSLESLEMALDEDEDVGLAMKERLEKVSHRASSSLEAK